TEASCGVTRSLAGDTVVILDDLITTGSTLRGSADALLAAGAERVYAAAIGRVVNPPRPQCIPGEPLVSVQFQWLAPGVTGQFISNEERFWLRFLCSHCPAEVR